ncbi:unnamed protein product [Parnassius mnemosyne]|uniref:Uncharacterized protein n=1 Tax=Parnassius mnemosyne TaxID=213953 RepID=A0AAV1KLV8_9NEOP
MRNEVAVSFFFCIGIASGYIVPSSIIKITKQELAKKAINLGTTESGDIKSFGTKLSKTLIPNLENSKNCIDDSEILSQGAANPKNINERSFIFIRQKFKTPMLNLFHSQMQNPNDILHDLPKSIMTNSDNTGFEELSQRFLTLNIVTPAKEIVDSYRMAKALDKTQGTLLTKSCNKKISVQQDNKKYGTMNQTSETKIQDVNNVSNEQREYLELLKTPLVRSNNNDEEVKSVLQETERQASEAPNAQLRLRNHNTISKISLDLRQSLVKKYNTEYSHPYESKLTFFKSELANQHEQRDSTFILDDDIGGKVMDGSIDDDQGWDQYLKNALEEKSEGSEGKGVPQDHINRIHYCHDCNINKNTYNNRMQIESDCKCGHHVYLRGRPNSDDQDKNMKSISTLPSDKRHTTPGLDNKNKESNEDKTGIDVTIPSNALFN